MPITITLPSDTSIDLNFSAFYEKCAKAAGYHPTQLTHYDCRKILVAKNIINAMFEYAKNNGIDTFQVSMCILMVGPKADESLKDWQVVIEDGFAYEKPFNLQDAIKELLNNGSDEDFESIVQAFNNECQSDDESWRKKGREMLAAYLDGDVDRFCIAATGWSVESILKRAKVIPDYDHTFN